MRVIQPDEFKKMAQTVVSQYVKSSVPLVDSLTKTALESALNPDQIRNLVQLANTMAHLTLFDQKKDDKIVEFEPADPDIVIKKVYVDGEPVVDSVTTGTGTGMGTSTGDDARPLRSDTADMFGDFDDVIEKIKGMLSTTPTPAPTTAPEPPTADTASVTPHQRQMLIIKIRKVASEIENQKYAMATLYQDELDKLASEYAKLYGPDHKEFEKDAFALRGARAIPVLADLRHSLRLPALQNVSKSLVKTARVVDATTPSMRTLDTLIKLSSQWNDLAHAHQYLVDHIGEYL